MTLDLAHDWEVFDDTISVEYIAKESRIDYAPPVIIDNCLLEHVLRNQITVSGGDLTIFPSTVTFLTLWREKLDEATGTEHLTPRQHDLVRFGGNTYSLENVEYQDWDGHGEYQRFRCELNLTSLD